MQQTIVGASVNCYVNGLLYGQVKTFRWSPSTPHKEARGLDVIEAVDLIPLGASVSGTIGVWRQRLDGGAQGIGAGVAFSDLPHARFFTIQLKEQMTQTVIFESRFSTVVDESWGVEAKGVVEGMLSFKGINWKNEIQRVTVD